MHSTFNPEGYSTHLNIKSAVAEGDSTQFIMHFDPVQYQELPPTLPSLHQLRHQQNGMNHASRPPFFAEAPYDRRIMYFSAPVLPSAVSGLQFGAKKSLANIEPYGAQKTGQKLVTAVEDTSFSMSDFTEFQDLFSKKRVVASGLPTEQHATKPHARIIDDTRQLFATLPEYNILSPVMTPTATKMESNLTQFHPQSLNKMSLQTALSKPAKPFEKAASLVASPKVTSVKELDEDTALSDITFTKEGKKHTKPPTETHFSSDLFSPSTNNSHPTQQSFSPTTAPVSLQEMNVRKLEELFSKMGDAELYQMFLGRQESMLDAAALEKSNSISKKSLKKSLL
jgi:hypothetical protein